MKKMFDKIVGFVMLALATGAFPIYECHTDNEKAKENLGITLQSYPPANTNQQDLDYHVSYIENIGNNGIISTYWALSLTNKSSEKNVVNEIEVFLDFQSNKHSYLYIYQGIFDKSYNRLHFPINLDAQESKDILLKIGLPVGSNASNVIKEKIQHDLSYSNLTAELYRNGIDFFDNRISPEYEIVEYQEFKLEITSNPKIYISFETLYGSTYDVSAFWYEINN